MIYETICWQRIGMAHANAFLTWPLNDALQEIKSAWLARRELPNVGSYRKELRRFRAITAKRRELRKQFGPVVREAIALAGFLRGNPNADESTLRALMQDSDGKHRPRKDRGRGRSKHRVRDR